MRRGRHQPGRQEIVRWVVLMAPPLALFWTVLSGHFTPLLIAFGVLSVALVCWLSWRADFPERDDVALPLSPGLPAVRAVAGQGGARLGDRRWCGRCGPRGRTCARWSASTAAPDMSVLSQVVYANSITLTPGTLSLDVDDDRIKVHSLDTGGRRGAPAPAQMLRRVRRLESAPMIVARDGGAAGHHGPRAGPRVRRARPLQPHPRRSTCSAPRPCCSSRSPGSCSAGRTSSTSASSTRWSTSSRSSRCSG